MKQPRTSVLTVVRNDKDGLLRTVESARKQSQSDWELLIKDGNSTDGTAELALSLSEEDPRIRLVEGRDRNLYDAMNIALAAATGEYVLFLNAGDVFHDDEALARALAAIDASETVVDIAYFATLVALETGRSYERPAKPVDYIRYGQPAIHQSTLIRTELHRNALYDHATYPNIADYVAVARMVRNGAFCASFPERLARFEVTAVSSSFANQAKARKEFRRAIKEIWGLSLATRIAFNMRRWLAMAVVRVMMR